MLWVLLNTVYLVISAIKIMYFLRVYEKFVILVELIFAVFEELIQFTLIFIAHIIMFALLNIISGTGIPLEDYNDTDTNVAYML